MKNLFLSVGVSLFIASCGRFVSKYDKGEFASLSAQGIPNTGCNPLTKIGCVSGDGTGVNPSVIPAQTAAPSPEQTAAPSPVQTAAPSPVQTAAPSPVQTAAPSPVQTAAPSPVQTAAPSPVKTASPTPKPTKTPCPDDHDDHDERDDRTRHH